MNNITGEYIMHYSRNTVYFCVPMILWLSGCHSVPKPDFSKFKPAGPAQSVIAVWEPAVNTCGDKPVRGFGGRVYFYDSGQTKPVKVNGTVVVYAFNENGRSADNTKPDEGYVFDDKTLNSKGVYKKSKLGPSYNLWIPIDSAGPDGEAKRISLIVRYMPKKGSSVVSSQATAYLPGKHEQNTMVAQAEPIPASINTALPNAIQQTGGIMLPKTNSEKNKLTEETAIELNDNRPQAMQTVTIRR
jgi:hypothetical protein